MATNCHAFHKHEAKIRIVACCMSLKFSFLKKCFTYILRGYFCYPEHPGIIARLTPFFCIASRETNFSERIHGLLYFLFALYVFLQATRPTDFFSSPNDLRHRTTSPSAMFFSSVNPTFRSWTFLKHLAAKTWMERRLSREKKWRRVHSSQELSPSFLHSKIYSFFFFFQEIEKVAIIFQLQVIGSKFSLILIQELCNRNDFSHVGISSIDTRFEWKLE